ARWYQLRRRDQLPVRRPHRIPARPDLPQVLRARRGDPHLAHVLGSDVGGRARGRGTLRAVRTGADEPTREHRREPLRVELHDVLELGRADAVRAASVALTQPEAARRWRGPRNRSDLRHAGRQGDGTFIRPGRWWGVLVRVRLMPRSVSEIDE